MRKIFLTFLALMAMSTAAASASITPPPNLRTVRLYKVYWSGVHVADLKAEVKEGEVKADIDSYGIVKKVSKYSSTFKTTYDYKDGKYLPQSYYTAFTQRNGGRTIDLKYDENGVVSKEAVNPPDKRYKRPAVKDEAKLNSLDPLTAVLAIRQDIRENIDKGNDEFSLKMYDGRRLSSLDFKIHGQIKRKINDVEHDVVKVSFKRSPIEGYTNNELRRIKKEEPTFTLYLSDDKYLLPIKADAEAPLGTAVLLLEKECESYENCGY